MTPDDLWGLVGEFLRRNLRWVRECAEPLCDEASAAFCQFCFDREVDAVARWGTLSREERKGLVEFLPWIVKMDQRYPLRDSLSRTDEHCVAVVDDRWVVDLTARQYGDDMPFPFLWELDPSDRLDPLDRRNDDPRVGDRVRARCFINMAAARGDEGVVLKVLPGRRMGFVDFSPRNLPMSPKATVLFSDGEVEVVERAPAAGGSPC